MGKMETDM